MQTIGEISQGPCRAALVWQRVKKFRHAIKKRLGYLVDAVYQAVKLRKKPRTVAKIASREETFEPGELIRVRSKEEIRTTLDHRNRVKGCVFMEEMYEYCGTRQVIYKKVSQFLDERDYRLKTCKDLYLLQDLVCNGLPDFGACDRSCLFFWRQEWLEKIS